MLGFILNLFLYTFAIYGLIIFFKEIVLSFTKYKNTCKMVLILQEKNVEEILRDISWMLQDSNIISNIYVLNKTNSSEANEIIQRYCTSNEFFILADKQKILEIMSEEVGNE